MTRDMPRWMFILLVLVCVSFILLCAGFYLPLDLLPRKFWLFIIRMQPFAAILAGIVLLMLGYLIWRHLVRRFDKHKGLRVLAQREKPLSALETWSTHLSTPILKSIWWRFTSILPFVKPKHFRAIKNPADRDELNALSLRAFEILLNEKRAKPGVLIISTSLLNRRNRSATRLQQRIDAVGRYPDWRCQIVVRDLGVIPSVVGWFLFGWKSVEGEFCSFQAPGIVVWRQSDGELSDEEWSTRLLSLKLRVASDEDLSSPVFSG